MTDGGRTVICPPTKDVDLPGAVTSAQLCGLDRLVLGHAPHEIGGALQPIFRISIARRATAMRISRSSSTSTAPITRGQNRGAARSEMPFDGVARRPIVPGLELRWSVDEGGPGLISLPGAFLDFDWKRRSRLRTHIRTGQHRFIEIDARIEDAVAAG